MTRVPRFVIQQAALRHGLSRDDIRAVLAEPVYAEPDFQSARGDREGMNTLVVGRHPRREELIEVVLQADPRTRDVRVFHAMSARGKTLARMDPELVPPDQQRSVQLYLVKARLEGFEPGSRAMRAQLDQVELRLQQRQSARPQQPRPARRWDPPPPTAGPSQGGPQL